MIAMRAQPKIMPLIFEDLVLEDAGGRVILLELKAGTARTPLLAELISENSQAAILTGSIAGTLATAMAEWIRQEGSYRDVLDALAPKERGTLSAAAVLQARQNAAARHQFLEEFPALTSADVADAAGSKATNRASLANRWREEGKVFAIRVGDQQLYPGFQFDDDGRPLRIIASVLRQLGEGDLSDWQTALWFTSPTGWLGGRRPVDLVVEEPSAVLRSAARETGELVA
ncbi:MAG: hypothetical protein ABSD82_07650 [Solirubrobacteraceae bacterium]|jgi:hypothetical protein